MRQYSLKRDRNQPLLSFSTFNLYRQTPCDLASSLGYEQSVQFLRNHSCATGEYFLSQSYLSDNDLLVTIYIGEQAQFLLDF